MKKALITLFAVLIFCFFLPYSPSALAVDGSTIVYVTNTGECYHMDGCSYLKSKNERTLAEAVEQGYRPCSRCHPPTLDSYTAPPVSTSTSTTSTTKSSPSTTAATVNPSTTNSKDDSFNISPTTLIIACCIVFFLGRSLRKPRGANSQAEPSYAAGTGTGLSSNNSDLATSSQTSLQQTPRRRAATQVVACPKCGKTMVKRYGKYGYFYGCSNFPYCRGTRNLNH